MVLAARFWNCLDNALSILQPLVAAGLRTHAWSAKSSADESTGRDRTGAAGMATTGAIKLDIGPDADESKDDLLSTRMASNRAVSEAHHGHRLPNRPPAR